MFDVARSRPPVYDVPEALLSRFVASTRGGRLDWMRDKDGSAMETVGIADLRTRLAY